MNHQHPQFLGTASTHLMVVDIQERLFKVMTEEGQTNLLKNVPILTAAANELKIPILVTEQYPKGIGPTIPDIKQSITDALTVAKIDFAATEEEEVVRQLDRKGRKQILLTGMEAHICVYQTALGLLKLGYDVHVVADATATRLPHNQAAGLALMERAGAVVTTTEAALFQLLERAGTEAFKKMQKMII